MTDPIVANMVHTAESCARMCDEVSKSALGVTELLDDMLAIGSSRKMSRKLRNEIQDLVTKAYKAGASECARSVRRFGEILEGKVERDG